jgi:serine/threonine-protein kinase HipA
VAPFYDLLSINIYDDEFDSDLAMAIGDEFVIDEILPYQLAEFCDICQLPQRQVAIALKTLCTAVFAGVGRLTLENLMFEDERLFARDLLEKIRTRTRRFYEVAQELPRVKL